MDINGSVLVFIQNNNVRVQSYLIHMSPYHFDPTVKKKNTHLSRQRANSLNQQKRNLKGGVKKKCFMAFDVMVTKKLHMNDCLNLFMLWSKVN